VYVHLKQGPLTRPLRCTNSCDFNTIKYSRGTTSRGNRYCSGGETPDAYISYFGVFSRQELYGFNPVVSLRTRLQERPDIIRQTYNTSKGRQINHTTKLRGKKQGSKTFKSSLRTVSLYFTGALNLKVVLQKLFT